MEGAAPRGLARNADVSCSFRLTATARAVAACRQCRLNTGPAVHRSPETPPCVLRHAKMWIVLRSPLVVPPRWLENPGVESPQHKGDSPMEICTPDTPATLAPAVELDRLGDEIAELSAHIEAATARLLDLIREFDARGGWNNGFRSCAAWLTWRVGLAPGAAREHVRVARALGTLPLLSGALARAEVSYSKVRALTRVATPETEERLLAVGRAGTTEHVERIVRGWRRVDRQAEAREAARQHAGRALHVYPDTDGIFFLRGRLTAEVGALLVQALAAAREALYQRARGKEAEGDPPTMVQQQAD